MYDKVDEVIEHYPHYCQGCGDELRERSERKLHSFRQVVDNTTHEASSY